MAQRLNPHAFADIPVAPLTHPHRFLVRKGNLAGHLLQLVFPTLKDHFTVELQGAYVVTLVGMDMVQDAGVGEIAVKGEVARDAP